MRKQKTLERRLGVSTKVALSLIAAGLDTVKKVRFADEDTLSNIEGISKAKAADFVKLQPRRK